MKANKKFLKPYRRLLLQSVFFVPNELVVDGLQDIFQDMFSVGIDEYTDQLLYLSQNRKIEPLQNSEAFKNIITKRFQLEKTVSFLAKQKCIIDEQSFSYLLERYIEYVNALCFVSELLYENVQQYFPNESSFLYNTFLVQQNTINAHRDELVRILQIDNNRPYSLVDIEQMILKHNPAVKEMFSIETMGTQPDVLQTPSTDAVELISDEEAQNFLLQTVFSIPLAEVSRQ